MRGVIRGDHGFGPGPGPALADHAAVLHFNGMTRWCDHSGVPRLAQFGLSHLDDLSLPESFAPLPGESPADWRDRLYQLYRIPAYHAGQSDLKAAYVEIASPLFVRKILDLTRSHPEHLRSGKKVFAEVVRPHDVPVPYAVDSALVPTGDLMATPAVRELLCDELSSRRLRDAFTHSFADYLLSSFSSARDEPLSRRVLAGPRRYLRLWVPATVRSRLRRNAPKPAPDLRWVAVRAYIVSRMHERLAIDARTCDSQHIVERPDAGAAILTWPDAAGLRV